MMKKIYILGLMGIFLSGLLFNSCYYSKEEKLYPKNDCDTVTVTWNGQIKNLFANSCLTGCHDKATGFSGVELETYDGAKRAVGLGSVICAVEQLPGSTCSAMPKGGGKWDACKVSLVKIWKQRNFPQ